MEHKISEPNARVDVADVLRGLAVMGIIILHSISPVKKAALNCPMIKSSAIRQMNRRRKSLPRRC